MSASENQAAEARMDIGARKVGSTGNRIRIRLPPRKRLAEDLQTMSTGEPGDTKNHPAKEVTEHTDNNTESTTFVDAKATIEEVSTKPPGEGQYIEASSNCLCKTMSKDSLCEEANFIAPSLNLTNTNGVQGKTESTCPVRKGPCEEGNKNIMSNGLPAEELCLGIIDNSPGKKLLITRVQGEVENNNSITKPCEGASNNILNKRLLYETNINTSIKGVTEEAKINNPSKNLKTSALNCEEENDNFVGNNLFEEAKKNIAGVKLCTKALICDPSKRLPDPDYDKKSSKKLCISAVQATETIQNSSGMKLSTSADLAVEQSTSTAFSEGAKEYKEFEDKVKRTIYLDNLSPQATDAVIKIALNQFGNVRNVNFLTNYTVPFDTPQSALVEMETEKDAESVATMLDEFPFMISGMPRPVRVKRATVEMFSDRPRKPGRKLEFCWVGPTDPDYHDVRNFKLLCKRHEMENLALIKNELHEEALLGQHQQNNLNCQSRKLEIMDSVILNGWVGHLTNIYNLSFNGVY